MRQMNEGGSLYGIESLKNALRGSRVNGHLTTQNSPARAVPRVVIWVGITSLLTDLATEMVGSVLPAFLFSVLLLPPLMVGFMEGVYQGAAAILRLPTGIWADRFQKHKSVAALGYGMSAVAKLALLLSMQWGLLAALISLGLDRVGKAVRTAPRDVLIAAHAESGQKGAAFGVHRAMDAVGALAGPLLAFALLALTPEDYTLLLVVSLIIATLGFLAFLGKVPGLKPGGNQERSSRLFDVPMSKTQGEFSSWKEVLKQLKSQNSFWLLLWCAAALSFGVISDGLLYLYLQQKSQVAVTWLPLFYSGTALIFVLAAYPFGKLADRVGAKWLVVAGHALLMIWYLSLQFLPPLVGIAGTLLVMGCFYAATDGVLMAQAAKLLPSEVCTTGMALLGAVVGLMRLLSSTLFGALWQWNGQVVAFTAFSVVLGISIAVTVFLWSKAEI